MWVGGPWKSISLGLHNRFVDQILPPVPKVSGKQETAPLQPYTDTQSSDNKLDQHATWRLHHVCAEAIFTLPYSGLSGLRPFVTRGFLPARAEPAPVCQQGQCQCFLGATPWSLSGSFTADNFLLFLPQPQARGLRQVIAWGVLWPGRLLPAKECRAAQGLEHRHHPGGYVFFCWHHI